MTKTSRNTKPRRDIHAEITNQLIASIEADPGQPTLPWRRSSSPLFMPENALSKKPYNGINIVSLWVSAEVQGFQAPVWATYRQWSELGAQVRKGEKSSLVVFYKEYDAEPDPTIPTTTASAASRARPTSSTHPRSTATRCLVRRNP
ncbi:MAG: ArdC-like ssDNA-binding domain-containing protein [Nitrospiraceae bacterium]